MPVYNITRASTALSTTADLLTLLAAANRRVKIRRIDISGLATASAANVVLVQRSTGGVTPGGAITPEDTLSDAPAASTLVYTTWGTQPTLTAGAILERVAVNANGAINRIIYPPGTEPEIRNSEQLSFRSETGTSNVTITVTIEEM